MQEPPPPPGTLGEPPTEPPVQPPTPAGPDAEEDSAEGVNSLQLVVWAVMLLMVLLNVAGGQAGEQAAKSILMILVFGGVVFLAYCAFRTLRLAASTKRWKPVQATIQLSEPYETHTYVCSQPEGNYHRARRYAVGISYQYTVGDWQYEGTHYSIDNPHCMFIRRKDCEAIAQQYEGKTKVNVYYSETNPEDAVLERGFTINFGRPAIIFLIIIFLTTALFIILALLTGGM